MKFIKEALKSALSFFQERIEEKSNYTTAIEQLEFLDTCEFYMFCAMTGTIYIGYDGIVKYTEEIISANDAFDNNKHYVVRTPIGIEKEALVGRFFIKDGRFIQPPFYNTFIEESIKFLRHTEALAENPDRTALDDHNLRMVTPLASSIMGIANVLYGYAKTEQHL